MATHGTVFDTLPKTYADVPTKGGVPVEAFIQATEGLLAVFGKQRDPTR